MLLNYIDVWYLRSLPLGKEVNWTRLLQINFESWVREHPEYKIIPTGD